MVTLSTIIAMAIAAKIAKALDDAGDYRESESITK